MISYRQIAPDSVFSFASIVKKLENSNERTNNTYMGEQAVSLYLQSSEEGRVIKAWLANLRSAVNSVYVPREIQSRLSILFKNSTTPIEAYLREAVYLRIMGKSE